MTGKANKHQFLALSPQVCEILCESLKECQLLSKSRKIFSFGILYAYRALMRVIFETEYSFMILPVKIKISGSQFSLVEH